MSNAETKVGVSRKGGVVRCIRWLALAVVAAGLVSFAPMRAPMAAGGPGPALGTPSTVLAAALRCSEDLASASRTPVLLVHGTGATPAESWGWNVEPALSDLGFPVCTVAIRHRSVGDVQENVEYVVHAMRAMASASHRKLAVVGHSQGAWLITYALRFWPDLATKVDDVVGYGGTYTHGTNFVAAECAAACIPAFRQALPGSKVLAALAQAPLPAGPSYTTFATRTDEIVHPQPEAGRLDAPRARNYMLQDICPDDVAMHVSMLDERPFHALLLDALTHPGPAELSRVRPAPCGHMRLLGWALQRTPGLSVLSTRSGVMTSTEPPLRCYLRPACRQAR